MKNQNMHDKKKEVQTMSLTETMLFSTEALAGYYYFTE
jgi:hypothetical protein